MARAVFRSATFPPSGLLGSQRDSICPTRDSENVSVKVDDTVDKSKDSQDVSPLQASRMWVTPADNYVIDRLVEAGLVAPLDPGRL
jgi:hypothetical protein